MEAQAIWPKDTGIRDLPEDISILRVASISELRTRWDNQKHILSQKGSLSVFSEQLSREWAIETGQIENLYDIERGVTVALIEQGFSAALLERGSTNKPTEFVLSIINDQKDALEGLFTFVSQNRTLSVSYIRELHAAMTRSQESTDALNTDGSIHKIPLIRGDWKQINNFPVRNRVQYLYCPQEHTSSEMIRLVDIHLAQVKNGIPSEIMAAWLHHRFTQIHPFQDGNGRVARALASLVLIQGGLFPLVVPREEKNSYLDALEDADGGNLRPFILLISRLQHREFDKSLKLVKKLEPHSLSASEAASLLSETLQCRSENAQQSRLSRLAKLRAIFIQVFNNMLALNTKEITRANSKFTIAGPNREEIKFLQNNRFEDYAKNCFYAKPASPIHVARWQGAQPEQWKLNLYSCGILDDTAVRLGFVLSLEVGGKEEFLSADLFELRNGSKLDANDENLKNTAEEYSNRYVASLFNQLRMIA